MILLLILPILAGAWLLSGWSIMLLTGMIHHEILTDVVPISYTVSLKFAAVLLLFASISGVLKGVIEAGNPNSK